MSDSIYAVYAVSEQDLPSLANTNNTTPGKDAHREIP